MLDRFNREYREEITLTGVTQKDFEDFRDRVQAELENVEFIFQDKPLMGAPYVVVRLPTEFGFYPLIVEFGYSLYIGETTWVDLASGIV